MGRRFLFGNSYQTTLNPQSSSALNIVDEYSDLPSAPSKTDEIYQVTTTTGTIFVNRHRAGQYWSDGTDWIYISGLQNIIDLPDPSTMTGQYIKSDGTNFVAGSPSGSGDMQTSVYDPTASGKVLSAIDADEVPWAGISGVPDMFTPNAHNHVMSEIDDLPTFGNAITFNIGTGASTLAEGNHTHTGFANVSHEHVVNDITDFPTLGNSSALDTGTTTGTVATGDHGHTGYANTSHEHVVNDITDFPTLGDSSSLDVGTLANTVAAGNHTHDMSSYAEIADTVQKADALIQSILIAVAENDPQWTTIPENTIVGRLPGGNLTALSLGILDNNIIQADSSTLTSGEYAKFTANGLESKSVSEVMTDIGALAINSDILSSNTTYKGETTNVTVDANTYGFGCTLTLTSVDGHYDMANATDTTKLCKGIACESGTGTKKILTRGQVCNTSWNFNLGDPLYLSTTDGEITQTVPSATGNAIQILGWPLSNDTIEVNITHEYLTRA